MVVAALSAIAGIVALVITLTVIGEPVSLGTLLGVILLVNALVRLRLSKMR